MDWAMESEQKLVLLLLDFEKHSTKLIGVLHELGFNE
jgi:hypothetical protein